MPLQLSIITIDVFVIQRLKELKQREFYRALACRRQRRRREERREERALRSLRKNEARRPGEWLVLPCHLFKLPVYFLPRWRYDRQTLLSFFLYYNSMFLTSKLSYTFFFFT